MAKIKRRRNVGAIVEADAEWIPSGKTESMEKAKEHGREVLTGQTILGQVRKVIAFGEQRFGLSPRMAFKGDEDVVVDHKGVTLLPNHGGLVNRLADLPEGSVVFIQTAENYTIQKGPWKGKEGVGYNVEELTVEGFGPEE